MARDRKQVDPRIFQRNGHFPDGIDAIDVKKRFRMLFHYPGDLRDREKYPRLIIGQHYRHDRRFSSSDDLRLLQVQRPVLIDLQPCHP